MLSHQEPRKIKIKLTYNEQKMGNTKRRLNETENRKTIEKIHKMGFYSGM